MDTSDIIKDKKKALETLGVYKRLNLWLKIHKDSERYHNLLGGAGIICATLSSQLSEQHSLLFITGMTAAISTAMLTFLNLKGRSCVFINAWRKVDKAVNIYLTDEQSKLDAVRDAINQAEEYIQNSLHKN